MHKILKQNTEHRTATFVVLEPGVLDYNGQVIDEDEVIKTAHEFMMNIPRKYINVNHTIESQQHDISFVESFVLPIDIQLGDEIIKKGSWLVAFKFSEEKWQQFLDGEIVGVSMEGFGFID